MKIFKENKTGESALHEQQCEAETIAYIEHVLRGSSGSNALLLLEGKFEEKKVRPRHRRTRIDDLLQWT